jgi:hypothetical protein
MREYYARFCENLGLKYPGLLDNKINSTKIDISYHHIVPIIQDDILL